MKKSILFLFVILLSISCSARPKANNEIQTSKMDLRLRTAYDEQVKLGDFSKKFECFIKLSENVDDAKLNALKSAGFETRTYTKTILTGTFMAKDLVAITNLDFVKYIELAVPMSTK